MPFSDKIASRSGQVKNFSCISLGGLTAIAGGVRVARGAGVVCSRMGVKN